MYFCTFVRSLDEDHNQLIFPALVLLHFNTTDELTLEEVNSAAMQRDTVEIDLNN